MPTNDNYPEGTKSPRATVDPHGHAALILVESLIHVLKDKGVLTTAELLDVASTAMEVQEDHACEADATAPEMWRAHALLSRIAASLETAADQR